jgi:hypothetical protein
MGCGLDGFGLIPDKGKVFLFSNSSRQILGSIQS